MMSFTDAIEASINKRINEIAENPGVIPDDVEYVYTDNLGEIVEKLTILHIRTWMLEDAIQAAQTPEEIATLKKKIDICFKIKRPNLVQALNRTVDDAIKNGRSLVEDSVKLYKGIE